MYSIIQPGKTMREAEGEHCGGSAVTVFLAGTIEMGRGIPWHADAAARIYGSLKAKTGGLRRMPALTFFNPRRDGGFTPGMEERQIRWEQKRLREADYLFMYLQPDTKSPISLLEFGQFISSGRLYVACAPGFYRWRNLKITAEFDRMSDHVADSVDECVERLTDAMVAAPAAEAS